MPAVTQYEPWLSNLNDPSKLTPDQKRDCGLGILWSCSVKKGRGNCFAQMAAANNALRAKCEQFAALAPPPVVKAPSPTNPPADPAAAAVSQEQQLASLRQQLQMYQGGGGAAPIAAGVGMDLPALNESALYGSGGYIDRGQGVPAAPGGVLGGVLEAVPAWAWLAAAGAAAYFLGAFK
jgi:hypothetical protein